MRTCISWATALALMAAAGPALAQTPTANAQQWVTRQIVTEPLTFLGTGTLGLAAANTKWETRQIVTEPLTFLGTGTLGLAATNTKWETRQIVTEPLIFLGTGKLTP
ncbi:hypothetical protein RS694_11205 [Rhodoferax saidenbachensis]|uniref:Uncharacterized protein n=2 Tax=Rhodoferax saidenbachensis TaxID=1484693 RepID=A0A1P8KAP1_9BURK|nr:hypothetical protein RS694_11205 [Rhodoferax saidenbachensis]